MVDGSPILSASFLNCCILWNMCYNFDIDVNVIEERQIGIDRVL